METIKPMLVGEMNPYGADPEMALVPFPDGCSGQRLCCLILRMYRKDYLEAFDRVNLCEGKWSVPAARARAGELWSAPDAPRFVLLGAKVSKAFCVPYVPFEVSEGGTMLVLPHPSGLCRAWNDVLNYVRAREAVCKFLADTPVAALVGKYTKER